MKQIKTVYLAGKISGDLDNYRAKFNAAAARLESLGYAVMNPAILPSTGFEYQHYMCITLAMLDGCDAICLLPCWEESPGACNEVRFALYNDLTVLLYEDVACKGGRWLVDKSEKVREVLEGKK